MTWHLSIENLGGIRQGEARLEPGVNAVRASNWQGKSSFLSAIETVCGTATPLTEGQETGRVALRTDGEEYTVTLERADGTVTRAGRPYLQDEYDRVCASLFSFLDEDNEIRRAVSRGADLESLLTRPLDFENIDERIADIRREREQVSAELDRARDAGDRLPALQERVADLEARLESLRAERADLDVGADDAPRERLSDLRAERERLATRIDRLETTESRVHEKLAESRTELDSLSVPEEGDVESDLESLRADLRAVERDRELLQSVYEANRRVLDEGRADLLTDVTRDVLADEVTCWLCGSEATTDALDAQLDALDARIGDLRETAAELRDRASTLEATREERREARRREADLTDRVAELESRLAEVRESLEAARDRRDEVTAELESLEATAETADDRLTDLESDIKLAESELEDAREELAETEARAERRTSLQEAYDSLTEDLTDLRTRKDRVKRRTREAFSAALEDLTQRFGTGFETARLTGAFELVVARDGREASLDALSEGERELLGIVAALAGHEAFDVGDRVPVLLLDGLGGLASDNLHLLVEYLRGRAEYLVLTAYPEYGRFDGHELSPADWQVVSHGADAEAPS